MTKTAILCSVIFTMVVLATASVALVGVWCWKDIQDADALKYRNWIDSVVLTLVTIYLLARVWCQNRRHRKADYNSSDEGLRDSDCTTRESPYPSCNWDRVVQVRYKSDLCLARRRERLRHIKSEDQYIVVNDYIIYVELCDAENKTIGHHIKVPRGMLTDLASVPRLFRPFVGRVGPHLEATIVHDYLYIAWQQLGIPATDKRRLFADQVMLAAMLEAGMVCRAFAIYRFIRFFGKCIFYGRNPEPLILCHDEIPDCCRDKRSQSSSDANAEKDDA